MITVRFKNTFRERLPEWATSFAMFLWGVIVYTEPSNLWSLEYFSVLAQFAPQYAWGLLTMCLGGARLIALTINGAWRPTAHIRAAGALSGILVWSAILLGYLSLSWNPPAIATKTAMLILDLMAMWYAAGDAKLADVKARAERSTPIPA